MVHLYFCHLASSQGLPAPVKHARSDHWASRDRSQTLYRKGRAWQEPRRSLRPFVAQRPLARLAPTPAPQPQEIEGDERCIRPVYIQSELPRCVWWQFVANKTHPAAGRQSRPRSWQLNGLHWCSDGRQRLNSRVLGNEYGFRCVNIRAGQQTDSKQLRQQQQQQQHR